MGRRLAIMTLLLVTLAACGFKGPLYLPDQTEAGKEAAKKK